ncbi:MAG TPA: SWIM zinc finger family protein [Thermodesulfobacteriota bacterium]|nr:SWIM zinc finger family protein [Thermodesulfobacteriota bacterium]
MNQGLNGSKERWIRGQELYKSGAVTIGRDGCFHVNSYLVDVEKVWCECPDYQHRKQPCKHFYAVRAFQKYGKPEASSENGSEKQMKANNKNFDKQTTITTRLAVLNTATEILKTHQRPVVLEELLSLAEKLEIWALGR